MKVMNEGVHNMDAPLEKPNVAVKDLPLVKGKGGKMGTTRHHTVEVDGSHVVLPSVHSDGRIKTHAEAIGDYLKTGQHLGKYKDGYAAKNAAQKIQQEQEMGLADSPAEEKSESAAERKAEGDV